MSTALSRITGKRAGIGFETQLMTGAHWVGALLATITGVIHLYLFWQQGFPGFLFAGVVFLAAVFALLLNLYRRILYVLGIPFTAGQIVIWFAQGMPDMSIAIVDKPIQVVLILVLVYLFTIEEDVQERAL